MIMLLLLFSLINCFNMDHQQEMLSVFNSSLTWKKQGKEILVKFTLSVGTKHPKQKNVLLCLSLYRRVCCLTQIFAYSGQVLIDSVYSHNLPVLLQSWVSLLAYRSLSDSPWGYHSNPEWSPRMPANREKKRKSDKWEKDLKKKKRKQQCTTLSGAKHLINESITNGNKE